MKWKIRINLWIRKIKILDMMHEQTLCCDEAANHQLPTAVAFWIIWIVSVEECSSLVKNLVQIHCSTSSVIFNVMATQYTCSLSAIYLPHWLVQWSPHHSCMCIPVHSSWLPGYMDVKQTLFITLTIAGVFLDRLDTHTDTPTLVFGCSLGDMSMFSFFFHL